MKTIKEIQEENRKLIILANNRGAKTYEQVKYKIIGKPLTLQRVLGAVILGERDLRRAEEDMRVIINLVYDWDYNKEVLEKQTEDYQLKVNKLLTK
jgi:hypothetical protein